MKIQRTVSVDVIRVYSRENAELIEAIKKLGEGEALPVVCDDEKERGRIRTATNRIRQKYGLKTYTSNEGGQLVLYFYRKAGGNEKD